MRCDSLVSVLITTIAVLSTEIQQSHGSSSSDPKNDIVLTVDHERQSMKRNGYVFVACSAQGREHVPYIDFFRRIGNGVTSVSSVYPGAFIHEIPSHTHNQVIKGILFNNEAWYSLHRGDNYFYCRARDVKGRLARKSFIITRDDTP